MSAAVKSWQFGTRADGSLIVVLEDEYGFRFTLAMTLSDAEMLVAALSDHVDTERRKLALVKRPELEGEVLAAIARITVAGSTRPNDA